MTFYSFGTLKLGSEAWQPKCLAMLDGILHPCEKELEDEHEDALLTPLSSLVSDERDSKSDRSSLLENEEKFLRLVGIV